MHCPVCNDVDLVMSDRQGIEIDYCPKCRGVWLDRGELDKIIERSSSELSARGAAPAVPPAYPNQPQQQAQPYQQPYQPPPQHGHQHPQQHYPQHPQQQGHGYPQQSGYYKKKKREGFWGELFDFD